MTTITASQVRRACDYLAKPPFPVTRAEFALCLALLDALDAGTFDGTLPSAVRCIALDPAWDLDA
jgi:hypothetical protein